MIRNLTLLALLTLLTVGACGHWEIDDPLGPGKYTRQPESTIATIGSVVFGVPAALGGFCAGLLYEPVNFIMYRDVDEIGVPASMFAIISGMVGGHVGRNVLGWPVQVIHGWIDPEEDDE